jgi:site-specific DNA-methyltransferase (adenine-specific)
MILCDLPCGTTACKWDVVIPFEPLWEQYNRVIKDNGAIVLFGSEPFSSKLRMSNLKMYKYDWYWCKSKSGNFMNANKQPHKKVECVSVFYKKQCVYNAQKIENPKGVEKRMLKENKSFQKTFGVDGVASRELVTQAGKNYEADKLLPTCLLEYPNENKTIHPTQKPIALLEYLIKTYTNEGEIVLDNCMGSGSTGVACVNTNRNFIGMELDENYFNIAKKRIENAKGGVE